MKTRIFHILLVAGLALFLVQPACAETLTVRADVWAPYNGEPNTPQQGYMIIALKEMFKARGVAVDYQTLPWEECLDHVRNGEFDAVVGASREDAPDFVFPSESFGKSDTAFFVRRQSPWKFTGIASLKHVRLGVIKDYSYNEDLDRYLEAQAGTERIYVAEGENPLPELITLLQAGKIDVIAEDSNVMLNTLTGANISAGTIVPAGKHAEITDVYVAFSPRNPRSKEFAAIFDNGIRELRNSGKLEEILFLYGLRDWQ